MNFVSIILDAVLVLIVIIGMISGVKRGFVRTVAAPVKFVAALVLAFTLCEAVSANFIEGFISEPITNQLRDFMYEKCQHLTADNVSTELPTLLKMSAGMFGLDVEEIAQTSVNNVLDAIITALTDPIIRIVGLIVSFILTYIAAKIVLSLAIVLINAILSAGPLGIINKLLGFVFGTAFSIIIAWALVAVADFAMGFVGYNLEAGFIYNFFHNLNPLDLLLSF